MNSVTKNEKPCLLVGDIGGTNVRFALADANKPAYSKVTSYECVDFASADKAIETYLKQTGAPSPRVICMATGIQSIEQFLPT